jgi:GT2 family glycosyltransferase
VISVVVISKDERGLDETLADLTSQIHSSVISQESEILVVDASAGRLDDIRRAHSGAVRWLDFEPPAGVRVSIPHQRNAGVRQAKGDIIVFTDAGCRPRPGWLDRLVAPLEAGGCDDVTAGVSQDLDGDVVYKLPSDAPDGKKRHRIGRITRPVSRGDDPPCPPGADQDGEPRYLREAPTLNLAFRREVFDKVGGFDERFEYGSDVDFTWRLGDLGYRIRCVPDAVVRHDYGPQGRQHRRAFRYGKARARLYRKHAGRRKYILRDDACAVLYPLFILGLPLTLLFPPYPLLLLIPAWRNRSEGMLRVVVDHLWFGWGVLAELAGR